MALLTLQDIGKIYVSEGNVAVGIRGVNLSFERGEFVAVTGKSGSGKSTLLNVISGMDSYEEGELLIEGQSTSHYLQPEWEDYRQKYISFIFQDYNIIESFTVLQNVELALMHIEDEKERRARAMELIQRVGLSSHVKHKGSRLSGGQKQRTVIARALAKDSPIILADEPTGNLDSATSREIIELLREVSRDKLLIVVTHNFEQVEEYATRHIRIFDGAVESDHVMRPAAQAPARRTDSDQSAVAKKKREIRNGFTLGRTVFTAKPRLSVFLCFLMIVGMLGIFLVTSLCGEAADMFKPNYMFHHIDGRVVVTTRNGSTLGDEELRALADTYGAESYLHYDALLDMGYYSYATIPAGNSMDDYVHIGLGLERTYGQDFGDDIVGRYPTAANEVFLYLPISYQPQLGKDTLLVDQISMDRADWTITGVKYYYDNNLRPQCLFTEDGFRTATALFYIFNNASWQATLSVTPKNGGEARIESISSLYPSFSLEDGKIYADAEYYGWYDKMGTQYDLCLDFSAVYYRYDYNYGGGSKSITFQTQFTNEHFTKTQPAKPSGNNMDMMYPVSDQAVYISDELLCDIAEEVLANSYKQGSLFFANDQAAHRAAERLQEAGYIAVPSDTTYSPDPMETVLDMIACLFMALVWLLVIVFLAFFINLCSARTLNAFKGDMAIMRSMGISVKVIRIGMYVRMLLALIPAVALMITVAILLFTSPVCNKFFTYLYAWQYALILVGMVLLTVRITHKQIHRLFRESVKKALKGGAAE